MKEEDRCPNCKGKKVLRVDKILEVAIESGCPNEHDYIFTGENDEYVLLLLFSPGLLQVTSMSASKSKDTSFSKDEVLIWSSSRRSPFLKL